MISKTLIAAAAVATLAAGVSAPAQAKVKVDLYVGGYAPQYYEPGYPVYDPYPVYEPAPRPHPHHYEQPVYEPDYSYGISCEEGRDQVRESGFYKVRPLDCDGKRYTYKARRDGYRYIVKVSARSGNIISVQQSY